MKDSEVLLVYCLNKGKFVIILSPLNKKVISSYVEAFVNLEGFSLVCPIYTVQQDFVLLQFRELGQRWENLTQPSSRTRAKLVSEETETERLIQFTNSICTFFS